MLLRLAFLNACRHKSDVGLVSELRNMLQWEEHPDRVIAVLRCCRGRKYRLFILELTLVRNVETGITVTREHTRIFAPFFLQYRTFSYAFYMQFSIITDGATKCTCGEYQFEIVHVQNTDELTFSLQAILLLFMLFALYFVV